MSDEPVYNGNDILLQGYFVGYRFFIYIYFLTMRTSSISLLSASFHILIRIDTAFLLLGHFSLLYIEKNKMGFLT